MLRGNVFHRRRGQWDTFSSYHWRRANLDYLDPALVDRAAMEADPDPLVLPHAGEVLYRLRQPAH